MILVKRLLGRFFFGNFPGGLRYWKGMEKRKYCDAGLDGEIKRELRVFRESGAVNCRGLLRVLWPFIVRFAEGRPDANGDRKDSFLTHIADIFPELFGGYLERDCRFLSWFYIVLSRHWTSFFYKRMNGLLRVGVPAELPAHPEQDNGRCSCLYTKLDRKERFLLKLRYPELLEEGDLERMRACGFLRAGCEEMLGRRIRLQMEEVSRSRRWYEDRLASLYLRKIRIQCRGGERVAGRLRRLARVSDRIAFKLRRLLVTMSYEDIAECTGLPRGSIASLIYRGRRKIRLSVPEGARRVS